MHLPGLLTDEFKWDNGKNEVLKIWVAGVIDNYVMQEVLKIQKILIKTANSPYMLDNITVKAQHRS